MAIHAIAGVMGSGKSYEAVSEKIVPAIKNGQRVVSNIHGLNHAEIAKYVKMPLEKVQALLLVVLDETVAADGFYPDNESDFTKVVHPGDLVVLDEVWRFYKKGINLPLSVMNFFRMHRHWSAPETGFTSDVVLCIQSVRGLHPDIKDVIELRLECRKLKMLGKPTHYQVFFYEGDSRTSSFRYDRKYNPAIFPLYKSHANGNAVEQIDKRQSVYNHPGVRAMLAFAVIAILGGLFFSFKTWGGLFKPPGSADAPVPAAVAAAPGPAAAAGAPAPAAAARPAISSADWRLVATYTVGQLPVVVLVDGAGRYRTLTPGAVSYGAGGELLVAIPPDSSAVASWSGPGPTYTKQASAPAPAQKGLFN